jgi:hypothetical protein
MTKLTIPAVAALILAGTGTAALADKVGADWMPTFSDRMAPVRGSALNFIGLPSFIPSPSQWPSSASILRHPPPAKGDVNPMTKLTIPAVAALILAGTGTAVRGSALNFIGLPSFIPSPSQWPSSASISEIWV